ncbi:MAG: hypothetical protein NC300_07820 [Bacteroidales bacterium]|nr:glutamine amidotransferase [Clostridium sp.]MCM1204037.1 hypothetical protein [Bacteroidales bacterium]
MAEKSLHICHLYYDILNLYGDNGNIRTMEKRLAWRGIGSTVTRLSFGEVRQDEEYDIIFIGGGQDFEQELLVKDLFAYKAEWLKREIEQETVILGICGGYQMLGRYYEAADGTRVEFLGGINVHTTASDKRMIGNFIFEYTGDDGETFPVVGFENHNGQTWLGDGVRPMGKMIKGFGNNGEDKTEGARYKNVFATYSHGPLLPKNAGIADELLGIAYRRKYGEPLPPLEHEMEDAARNDIMKQLGYQGKGKI